MTVKEMHHFIDLRLQKMSSNQYSKFEPDEIDTILNQAQHNFIKDRYTKMFLATTNKVTQMVQRGIDDLRSISVFNHTSKVIYPKQDTKLDYLYEPNVGVIYLPKDYMFLRSDRSDVKYIPEGQCADIQKIEVCNDLNMQEYKVILPFVASIQDICQNGTVNLQIKLKGVLQPNGTYADTLIFDYAWFSKAKGYIPYSGLREESDKYLISNLAIEFLNRFNSIEELVKFSLYDTKVNVDGYESLNRQSQFDVYWETYKDEYYPNSFVIISKNRKGVSTQTFNNLYTSTNDGTQWVSDTIYNSTNYGVMVELHTGVTTSPTLYSQERFKQNSYCRQVINQVDFTDNLNPITISNPNKVTEDKGVKLVSKQVQNKTVLSDEVYTLLNGSTTGTTKTRPLSTIKGNWLYVYNSDDFIVDKLIIDYIKIPRRISLRFNQSCELATHTHEEICMLAVEYIQKSIESQMFQITEQDNKNR